MKLDILLEGINVLKKDSENIEVKDIKINSKEVERGDMFIALKGKSFDGNEFIDDALKKGASVIVSENFVDKKGFLQVEDARSFYAFACKNFFGKACDKLKIVVITGTNGKTTTTHITKETLQFSSKKVGEIGTLGANYSGHDGNIETGLTTPDPYTLHKLFKEMKEAGCEIVVMEGSAHALKLKKLDGIKFEIGVLTNITEDHLDYFESMDDYANAKLSLFDRNRVKNGLICGDDERCRNFLEKSDLNLLSYGISENNDIFPKNLQKSFENTSFECNYQGECFEIRSPLIGEYNVQNTLASIGICKQLGLTNDEIARGINSLTGVEGRFNIIKFRDNNIIIDYAHTPDGLEKILKTAKDLSKGKVVLIFGCGGNRDKLKRPLMGEIASKFADEVIITSDNPRYENPMEIINEIKKGVNKNVITIEDRREAIEYALSNFTKNETIIIAGKGGEKYQEIKGNKLPFNDFDEVYSFIKRNVKK